MSSMADRDSERIFGALSCFDRVVITGTLVGIGSAGAMAATLTSRGFRLFDYTQFAEPLRDEVRAAAERLAAESGLEIESIQRKSFRKEERVRELLQQRPAQPRLATTPGQIRRPDLPPAQGPAPARSGQENRPHLQVLPDPPGPSRLRRRPAPARRSRPARARSTRMRLKSTPFCT